MPTPVLEVIDLSREAVGTKRNNAKLLNRTNGPMLELDESRTSERVACGRVPMAEASIKALEDHVAASDSKNSKTVERSTQVEEELCTRVTSLVAEPKVEKHRIARFAEDRMDEHTDEQEAFVARQKEPDALKDQLKNQEGTLIQLRVELRVATRKLKTLRHRAEKIEEELSIAQTGVSLEPPFA